MNDQEDNGGSESRATAAVNQLGPFILPKLGMI